MNLENVSLFIWSENYSHSIGDWMIGLCHIMNFVWSSIILWTVNWLVHASFVACWRFFNEKLEVIKVYQNKGAWYPTLIIMHEFASSSVLCTSWVLIDRMWIVMYAEKGEGCVRRGNQKFIFFDKGKRIWTLDCLMSENRET